MGWATMQLWPLPATLSFFIWTLSGSESLHFDGYTSPYATLLMTLLCYILDEFESWHSVDGILKLSIKMPGNLERYILFSAKTVSHVWLRWNVDGLLLGDFWRECLIRNRYVIIDTGHSHFMSITYCRVIREKSYPCQFLLLSFQNMSDLCWKL